MNPFCAYHCTDLASPSVVYRLAASVRRASGSALENRRTNRRCRNRASGIVLLELLRQHRHQLLLTYSSSGGFKEERNPEHIERRAISPRTRDHQRGGLQAVKPHAAMISTIRWGRIRETTLSVTRLLVVLDTSRTWSGVRRPGRVVRRERAEPDDHGGASPERRGESQRGNQGQPETITAEHVESSSSVAYFKNNVVIWFRSICARVPRQDRGPAGCRGPSRGRYASAGQQFFKLHAVLLRLGDPHGE